MGSRNSLNLKQGITVRWFDALTVGVNNDLRLDDTCVQQGYWTAVADFIASLG